MMDRLCDEIIQIILNALDDPSHFSLVSKRIHHLTQEPYVRSSYFLCRYGRTQALYWALGRGKLMNEKVIDVLISSGAHLSRYLAQCAIAHYFRAQVPFIKTRWVRSMSLPVFTHFMTVASRMYGDIPVAKGEDDGSIFTALLKASRFRTESRGKYDTFREVVEKYKFIPFCPKDPMMVQFPLVLAIEPRLLPYARANGFVVDRKYRNFIFRKMFEKPAEQFDGRVDEVINNVRELSRLDPNMFATRTVAAEICMEANTNEPGYMALKTLDKEGILKFELSTVVEELLKLFINTRSVSMPQTHAVLRRLYSDFRTDDPTVRLVMLSTIFFAETSALPTSITSTCSCSSHINQYVSLCKEKVYDLGLGPVTRRDLFELLVNKFAPEKFVGILEYGRVEVGLNAKGMKELLRELAIACLEIECKGKMLKKLIETDPSLRDVIASHVLNNLRLSLDDLPPPEDEKACQSFEARLCRDFITSRRFVQPFEEKRDTARQDHPVGDHYAQIEGTTTQAVDVQDVNDTEAADMEGDDADEEEHESEMSSEDLGPIGQDTLTSMIRKDEVAPNARRRRFYDMFATYSDHLGKLTYPADYSQVGRWVRSEFGRCHPVTAVFMIHAVLNENVYILQPNVYNESNEATAPIPVTLKHFKMLARLGRCPSPLLFDNIELGAEFYFDEDDYLHKGDTIGSTGSVSVPRTRSRRIKLEIESSTKPEPSPTSSRPVLDASNLKGKGTQGHKRPRRSATTVRSYAVPDSDDEDIAEDERDGLETDLVKKKRSETNLQRWIKHLSYLLREEQIKYKERRKRDQAAARPGAKIRVPKNEFFKSLSTNLPHLRKADREKRQQLYGEDFVSEEYSEGEEDEYQYRTTRSRRRKVEVV